jgi:hypothetical protein
MMIMRLPTGENVQVDDEDFNYLSGFKWAIHKSPSHPIGYAQAQETGSRKHWYMHRMIMARHGFDIAGKLVDHRNLNTLNNQKHNLRIATHCESQYNKGMQRNNRSGYKGVSRHRKVWVVQMHKLGKPLPRYYFANIKDAAQASMLLRFLHHGDFANLGKPLT